MDSMSIMPMQSGIQSSASILPQNSGYVFIEGKSYPVIKVPYNNPMGTSFVQQYREAVIVDGKIYYVEETSAFGACDKTEKTVEVNGKTYPVGTGNVAFARQMFSQLPKIKTNGLIDIMA